MTDPQDERIAALEAELAAVRADVQEFTYTVSHDLRAQLRHILAYAEIVQEDAGPQLDAEVLSHLATITGAARQMGALMDGLMAYARLGTVPLQAVAQPVRPLLLEVCQALQTQHPGRVLEWHIADDFPEVCADADLLRQAWSHVLGNALKFTRPRDQALVEVGWEAGAGGVCVLYVRDNGVGFHAGQQAKLFHVFQRLHSPREFEGIGMGLALTRKVVERHGGTVWAEGGVDAGCCIRFTLPLVTGGNAVGHAAQKPVFTAADYLAWESAQLDRHEYLDGEVFAMAGAEDRHVTVAGNVSMALRQHLSDSPCRTYVSAMRLHVAIANSYFYPDVLVTCSALDQASAMVKAEPKLIVEVLSPSTAAYDRGVKFSHYRSLTSLEEYVLIDLDTRSTDCYRKGADGLWVLHPFARGESVSLASVGLELTAEQLFAEVQDS